MNEAADAWWENILKAPPASMMSSTCIKVSTKSWSIGNVNPAAISWYDGAAALAQNPRDSESIIGPILVAMRTNEMAEPW